MLNITRPVHLPGASQVMQLDSILRVAGGRQDRVEWSKLHYKGCSRLPWAIISVSPEVKQMLVRHIVGDVDKLRLNDVAIDQCLMSPGSMLIEQLEFNLASHCDVNL